MVLRVNGIAGCLCREEAAGVVGLVWFLRLLIVQHLLALGPGLAQVLPFVSSDTVRFYIVGCPGAPVITAQQEAGSH